MAQAGNLLSAVLEHGRHQQSIERRVRRSLRKRNLSLRWQQGLGYVAVCRSTGMAQHVAPDLDAMDRWARG
ncbi:hypothetical protein FAZ78_00405 [Cereibacter changlensis]|uniref:Uncharacterized protein n=1 Tax=Cereibacter changlensis TaxID=402884 RepID=A0A4U0Z019_9RHOB|nr:hypothetical protein [Cereibacter changlensis]TKA98552.1 hypothetical protein FAZ78_00405 [Cereibacter changlensis]